MLLLALACVVDGPGAPRPERPTSGGAPDELADTGHARCPDGLDLDEDGWSTPTSGGTDCNDLDAAVNPGADDSVADGLDADCDGHDGPAPACAPAPETCDGLDEDCDGIADDPWTLVA